jgi:DNA-binding response OmpR family regulator
MTHAGTVIGREDSGAKSTGREFSPYDRSIDTHVCNLRKKIGRLTDGTDRIKGIRGNGIFVCEVCSLKILLSSFLTVIPLYRFRTARLTLP